MKKMQIRARSGFTLIELLVVVLIIGILSAVALPQYRAAVAKSRLSQAFVMGRALKNAEELYYMANGKYTTNLQELDIGLGGPVDSSVSENYSRNLFGNDQMAEVSLNGYGGHPNRIHIYIKYSTERTGIVFYLDQSEKKGVISCFSNKEESKSACKSMGGALSHHGEDTYYYDLP